jgi:hypothetical protein
MMKRKIAALSLAILFVILSLLFIPLQVDRNPEGSESITGFLVQSERWEYDINASVIEVPENNKLGVSVDYTELNFGYIPLGSSATKYLSISSQTPVKIHMDVKGDIKDFVTFGRNNFILDGPAKVPVTFRGMETGNFSGRVGITANKPRHGWLSWLMDWI